jgi:competence protein ComEC
MVVGPLSAFPALAAPRPLATLRALGAALLAERERWPLWLPVGFGTGVALYFGLPFEPPLWSGAVLGALGLMTAAVAIRSANTALRVMLAALAAVALGFSHAKLREARVEAPVLARKIGPVGIDGLVEQIEIHGKGVRIVLGEIHARRFKPGTAPARVRLSLRKASGRSCPAPGSTSPPC